MYEGASGVEIPGNSTMPLYLFFESLVTGSLISGINVISGSTTTTPIPASRLYNLYLALLVSLSLASTLF